MRQRFYRVASELLDTDPDVAVVLADIGTQQFREAAVFERHPDRVINVGIREQLMVTVAAGFALEGMHPIAHSYAPFLIERAFEQVKLDFAHQGLAGVLVSVGASYDWAQGGHTHHSPGDVALVASLPGWIIHVPGHPDEAELALRDAVAGEAPTYIRLAEQVNAVAYPAATTSIVTVRTGAHGAPAILAVGPVLDRVIEAARDIEATVLYTARPRPLDAGGLRAAVTGQEIVVVEPYLAGTSTAEIVSALSDRATRILGLGVPHKEHRHYGTIEEHDRAFGLDAPGLRQSIAEFVRPAVPA
jgi:transketolase